MSLPRALVLARRRGEASFQEILRGLLVHPGWLVPVGFFPRAELAGAYKVAFGPRHQCPPAELWIFSEHGTAQHAASQGAPLGAFVVGVEGTAVFGGLPPEVSTVRINPFGYPEDLLVLEAQELAEAGVWARTVDLEERLRRSADPARDGELLTRLRHHDAYHIPLLPDGRMLAKPGEGGFAQPGVVCTSTDSYEAFVAVLEPALRQQLRRTVVDGARLREELSRQDIDGVFLNPFGPGPTALWPLALLDLVAKR